MGKQKVRFVQDVTVKNGDGEPPGPSYKANQVVEFEDASAEYWINRRCAVPFTKVEEAVPQPAKGIPEVGGVGVVASPGPIRGHRAKPHGVMGSKEE